MKEQQFSLVPGREVFADVPACFAKRAMEIEKGNNLSYAALAIRLRCFAEGQSNDKVTRDVTIID